MLLQVPPALGQALRARPTNARTAARASAAAVAASVAAAEEPRPEANRLASNAAGAVHIWSRPHRIARPDYQPEHSCAASRTIATPTPPAGGNLAAGCSKKEAVFGRPGLSRHEGAGLMLRPENGHTFAPGGGSEVGKLVAACLPARSPVSFRPVRKALSAMPRRRLSMCFVERPIAVATGASTGRRAREVGPYLGEHWSSRPAHGYAAGCDFLRGRHTACCTLSPVCPAVQSLLIAGFPHHLDCSLRGRRHAQVPWEVMLPTGTSLPGV